LRSLGISETDFIRECDVTFKQSIKFVDWLHAPSENQSHSYHHVFDYAHRQPLELAPYWLMNKAQGNTSSYVDAVSIQGVICDAGLAPKTMTHPEYEGLASYAYHLDAIKFAALLTRHGTEKLGVSHLKANVSDVLLDEVGDISAVVSDKYGVLEADFFVDCSGFSSLLLGQNLGVKFVSKQDVLLADTALAMQIPLASDSDPIPSYTVSTAQEAGWIWDIGLTTRRGTGYVYSSKHTSDERAETVLREYAARTIGEKAQDLSCRKIPMNVGYREKFWHKNCVAVGLAQGFVEPLEATGLLVYDAAARSLAAQFPMSRAAIPALAEQFNQRLRSVWDGVIDFIKLHYYLSERDDNAFWSDNRSPDTTPESLLKKLDLWKHQPPSDYDFSSRLDIFNLDNYLYVLYGMGFDTSVDNFDAHFFEHEKAKNIIQSIQVNAREVTTSMLPNRELLARIQRYGLQKI
jgi:tryptophan halogenase